LFVDCFDSYYDEIMIDYDENAIQTIPLTTYTGSTTANVYSPNVKFITIPPTPLAMNANSSNNPYRRGISKTFTVVPSMSKPPHRAGFIFLFCAHETSLLTLAFSDSLSFRCHSFLLSLL
jgi:hypothetical protein